jgi:hypothetical protein
MSTSRGASHGTTSVHVCDALRPPHERGAAPRRAKSQGPAVYHACRSSHIAMLANAPPRPNLSQVSGDERASLELACFRAESQGPSTYNQCLSNHMRQLAAAPRPPNLSGLPPDEHQSIELAWLAHLPARLVLPVLRCQRQKGRKDSADLAIFGQRLLTFRGIPLACEPCTN